MKNRFKNKILIGVASLASVVTVLGQTETSTDPVGAITVSFEGSSGGQKSTNIFSVPLLPMSETIEGVAAGSISSVGSQSVQVDDAGWTPGGLSSEVAPFLLRLKSGTMAGLTLPISTTLENTATEIFLEPTVNGEAIDLIDLGIQDGDRFCILPLDTLRSFFGDPASTGIIGGESAGEADTILLFDGVWRVFFFHTGKDAWVESTFGFPIADNRQLLPDNAVFFERIGTSPLEFTVTGGVPVEDRAAITSASGVTFLSNGWPVGTTLGESGIEDIPGWRSGGNASSSDLVYIRSETSGWQTYFHNGTEWKRSTFGFPSASNVELPVASGIILDRSGGSAGAGNILAQEKPYNL